MFTFLPGQIQSYHQSNTDGNWYDSHGIWYWFLSSLCFDLPIWLVIKKPQTNRI